MPNDDLEPTEEQTSILEAAVGKDDLSIEALAGTGKTTTLKMLALTKANQNGTYIAFNKSIVDEAKSKFPSSVTCKTAHSLAYTAIGIQYKNRLFATQRLNYSQMATWMSAKKFSYRSSIADHVLDPEQVARYAMNTVRNFSKSIDQEIDIAHVDAPFTIASDTGNLQAFAKMILPLARLAWQDILKTEGFLKFSHDYYLKMWQLGKPKISSDYILFDEAQDADPVMLDVINSQSHAQLIYCGDQFQAIYEWRGAKNALKLVHVDQHLWLTQSFRFGDAIAVKANELLSLLSAPERVKGYDKVASALRPVLSPKAILCRTNAGVMGAVLDEQSRDRKVAIIGRTQDFIEFALACEKLQRGERTGHPELAPFLTWDAVLSFIALYPEDSQEIKSMVEQIVSFGVTALIDAMKKVVPESKSDVVISTAHRAKGREWESVKIQGDFLHIADMDTEDLRLAYVAITRAEVELDISAWEAVLPKTKLNEARSYTTPSLKVRPPIGLETEVKKTAETGLVGRVLNRADALESVTSEPESHTGKRWTFEEDSLVVELAMEKISLDKIAEKVSRKPSAIEARLFKWKEASDPQFRDASPENASEKANHESSWTRREIKRLEKYWKKGWTIERIKNELKCSKNQLMHELLTNDIVAIDNACKLAIEKHYS